MLGSDNEPRTLLNRARLRQVEDPSLILSTEVPAMVLDDRSSEESWGMSWPFRCCSGTEVRVGRRRDPALVKDPDLSDSLNENRLVLWRDSRRSKTVGRLRSGVELPKRSARPSAGVSSPLLSKPLATASGKSLDPSLDIVEACRETCGAS